MNEKEIVQWLIDNQTRGAAFAFCPKEVQDWINDNYKKYPILNLSLNKVPLDDSVTDWQIPALPLQFRLPAHKSWVEFEIDGDGVFIINPAEFGGYGATKAFMWWEYLEVLKHMEYGLTNFGGWQYEDSKRWYLSPAVKLHSDLWNSYVIEESEDATSVIPVKIRFWRE
jgi:hypothetical protein